MSHAPALSATAWSELAAAVTRWIGFHPDAIWARAVDAVVSPLLARGATPEEIAARARRDDPWLRRELTQAVAVGETYFFRIPQHFDFVRAALLPAWAADPARRRAVWSAGCATGEEAYTLAAVLRAGGIAAFEVVGTDLVEANVAAARAGRYGPWSLRSPMRAGEDPLQPATDRPAREVHPELRARTSFLVHNLLDEPPPPGQFDLVFCRNVLIYLTPDAAARVLARLTSALAPGGVIAFATMDLGTAPAPLVRVSAPEVQLYQRPPVTLAPAPAAHAPAGTPAREPPRRPERPPVVRPPPPAVAPGPAAAEPVSLHLRVLAHVEQGDHARARELLGELHALAPQYLPGLLEGALLHAREGRRSRAVELMRSVLARAGALPAEAPVAGPEILPASFYAAAARTFLGTEVRR